MLVRKGAEYGSLRDARRIGDLLGRDFGALLLEEGHRRVEDRLAPVLDRHAGRPALAR